MTGSKNSSRLDKGTSKIVFGVFTCATLVIVLAFILFFVLLVFGWFLLDLL
ncbi:MAG: hypothetical protein MN733_24600 [Nitrososphaera sp.]|nr:hypothetical protein [Nitrososphaera sp.]